MDRVTRAKYYAELAHAGQTYNDEVPYSVHLGQVIDVLRRFGVEDDDVYCAAWLHDSIEDTRISYNDIRERFGENVAELVFAVTNERGRNRKERNQKTYPKIFRAGEDALILKLADRIANVEYGLSDGTGKSDMYRKEFQDFSDNLGPAVPKEGIARNMWTHLQRLLS
jgi:(p)ppGpp synthase/HD superfamily hydrolase